MATKYLKSRNQELEIPEKNPFANDKLDRLHIASVLTDIVSFMDNPDVLWLLTVNGVPEKPHS